MFVPIMAENFEEMEKVSYLSIPYMGVASVEGRCVTESIVSKYEQSSEVTNTMEIDIINYLVNKTKTRKTIAKHAKFRKIFNSCEKSSFLRYVRCKDECRVKFPCSLKWQARSVLFHHMVMIDDFLVPSPCHMASSVMTVSVNLCRFFAK